MTDSLQSIPQEIAYQLGFRGCNLVNARFERLKR